MKPLLSLLILLGLSSPLLAQTPVKPKAGKSAVAQPERALEAPELAIAERVYVGRLPCELGQYVTIEPDPNSPGYFNLSLKKFTYRMHAVQSKSGAVRLDAVGGDAVWIQLSNKSMLVNAKLGKRMADVCTSSEQQLVAQAFEKTPPPSLFDERASPAVPANSPNQINTCRTAGLPLPQPTQTNGEKPC